MIFLTMATVGAFCQVFVKQFPGRLYSCANLRYVRSGRLFKLSPGFSLVELVSILAVIAILGGMLFPALGAARRQALRARTQSQLMGYVMAYEAFRSHYGYYPNMGSDSDTFYLKDNNSVFVETLSGLSLDGQQPESSYPLLANPERIRFYTFTTSDFVDSMPAAGGSPPIADAAGNPNIVAVIDRNQDGLIPAAEIPLPDAEDVRAGVIFFTTNPQNNPDWEIVTSW